MPRISTPAVSTNMYRHFAVLTVVVTLAVALFASGENRQAFAQEMENRRLASERAKSDAFKYGKPQLVQAEQQARFYNRQSDYRESSNDFGEAMDMAGSRVQHVSGGTGQINRSGGRYVPASYTAHQVSEEELAGLTPEQRAALLAQLANGGLAIDRSERQRQISTLVSASQRRAGSEAGLE